MEVIYPSCCGIDVHAKSVVVCLIKKGRKQTLVKGRGRRGQSATKLALHHMQ